MTHWTWMKKAIQYTVVTAASVALFGGAATVAHPQQAQAATVSSVHATHNVWLRGSAKIARNGIRYEKAGTVFTVLRGGTSGWWHVRDSKGRAGYVIRNTRWVARGNGRWVEELPPGVTMTNLTPRQPRSATIGQKERAVIAVAKSKLGTGYRWGHNEDRGQYGFDCSNFTAYVYHHALGYKMSGASQTQNAKVGWRISRSNMRPGDLLIFEHGRHVGIYVGHNRMIQCGGGLGKVGYLSIGPGSYWGKHLTSVRRMFH